MAWIRTIDPEDARGLLQQAYSEAMERANRIAGVVRLMSLEPATLNASMELYKATTTSEDGPNSRWFRELIAVTVSRLNQCFY